jgi:hypothetical protein
VGDEVRYPVQGYGHPVSYGWHLLPAERQAALLRAAGFTVTARLLQESRYLCLFAVKPEQTTTAPLPAQPARTAQPARPADLTRPARPTGS